MPDKAALKPRFEEPTGVENPGEALSAVVGILNKMLELHFPTAGSHSVRVSSASEFIAIQMSMTLGEIADIRTAALLHDIGKISVPQKVLQKDPSQLTSAEKTLIKQHPVIASGLLEEITFLEKIRAIIRHHHENYDGTGWPDRISRDNIPIGSRIISVTDTYDKIIYLPAASSISAKRDFAITHLRNNAGKLFDPAVVDIFLEFLDVKDMVDSQIMEVPVPFGSLKDGMVLARDLYTSDNILVFPKDTKLGSAEIQRIAGFNDASPIINPAIVYAE